MVVLPCFRLLPVKFAEFCPGPVNIINGHLIILKQAFINPYILLQEIPGIIDKLKQFQCLQVIEISCFNFRASLIGRPALTIFPHVVSTSYGTRWN